MTPVASSPVLTNVRPRGAPLYLYVLGLLGANFLLIVASVVALTLIVSRRDQQSLLMRPLMDRAVAVAGEVEDTLSWENIEDWQGALEDESQRLGVRLCLGRAGGGVIAGSASLWTPALVEAGNRDRRDKDRPGEGDQPRPRDPLPPRPRDPQAPERVFIIRDSETGNLSVVVRTPLHLQPERPPVPGMLVISAPIAQLALFVGIHWYVLGLVGLLVASGLLWWPLVRMVRLRLRGLVETADRIAQGDFAASPRGHGPRELEELAARIDAMSSRLSGFVHGQKRFVADIAHELCSPLARLQLATGILEATAGEAATSDIRAEAGNLAELVQELLMFSKAAAGASPGDQLQATSLRESVERVLARERIESGIDVRIAPDSQVLAHPALLARAIANVIRNAVRYAGDSGPITISSRVIAPASGGDAGVILTVRDCGPGVPEDAVAKLGDPFFRPDSARTREAGGNGLGLAIVKTCIAGCGGSVWFENVRDAAGSKHEGFAVHISLRQPQGLE
jgi:two-component system sensor histidine kinase CpxA